MSKKHLMFVGRWVTFHDGHKYIIKKMQKIKKLPVLIMIRETDEKPSARDRFNTILKWTFADAQGSTAYSMDRDRPYDGQSHTGSGQRGKTLVGGLTMRDVADCIVKGFLACGGIDRERPIYDDVYSIDLSDIDPIAVVQNAMWEIEKMMGIYPNLPALTTE